MLYSSDTVATVSTHFGKLLKGDSLIKENQKQFSLMKLEIKGLVEAINIQQQIEAMETHLYVLEHQLEDRLTILEQTAASIVPDSPFAANQTTAIEKERQQISDQFVSKITEIREKLELEKDKLEDIKLKTRRKLSGFLQKHLTITEEITDKLIKVVDDALVESGLQPFSEEQKKRLVALIHSESVDALNEQCRLAAQYPDQTNEKAQKAIQKELENLMKKQIEKFVNFILQPQDTSGGK